MDTPIISSPNTPPLTVCKPPSISSISCLRFAEKVNKLEHMLKKHGFDIPDDVKANKPPTTLMDLPDELLVKICAPVIRDTERPIDNSMATTLKVSHDSMNMRVGLLLVAYIARRFSANKRLRRIALGELFQAVVFSARLGIEMKSYVSLAESRLVISASTLGRTFAEDVSGLTPNIRHLELFVQPHQVTIGIKSKATVLLCLQGLVAKLAKSSNLLPNVESIHCAVERHTPTTALNNQGFDAFMLEVIEAMRQWKTKRRVVGFRHRRKVDKVIDGVQLWAKDVRSCIGEKGYPLVVVVV